MRVRVREVDGVEHGEIICDLARICLPGDDPPLVHEGHWWLAYVGDVAVGFAGLRDARTDPEAGFLCLAGVVPQARGRGLQRALIRARVAKARRLGKRRVISYTAAWNWRSANNLIACGFRQYMPVKVFGGGDVCYWLLPLSRDVAG